MGVQAVSRKDGTPVPGMMEMGLRIPGGDEDEVVRVSYFEESFAMRR